MVNRDLLVLFFVNIFVIIFVLGKNVDLIGVNDCCIVIVIVWVLVILFVVLIVFLSLVFILMFEVCVSVESMGYMVIFSIVFLNLGWV